MHVYLVTIISSLMLFFLCSPRRKRKDIAVRSHLKKGVTIGRTAIGVALAAFPPMIVAAVRYKVGTDYVATYYTGFYRILNETDINPPAELGRLADASGDKQSTRISPVV